jgi:hypothetical protein
MRSSIRAFNPGVRFRSSDATHCFVHRTFINAEARAFCLKMHGEQIAGHWENNNSIGR